MITHHTESTDWQTVETPLKPLLSKFQYAPITIAPERRRELLTIVKNTKLQLSLDCITPRFILQGGCGLKDSGIDLSLSALELLWMLSYVAMSIYSQWEAKGFKGNITFDKRTVELAQMARKRCRTITMHYDWPSHYPRPDAEEKDDVVRKANWLFVGSAGFAFLHELGHIVRSHSTSQGTPTHINFRYEFEADEWAYDWVMEKWNDTAWTTDQVLRRTVFMSGLFTVMAARGVCRLPYEGIPTHPNVIDRLLRFLIKHANEDSGVQWMPAWILPAHVLPFFLKLNGVKPPSQQRDNLRDVVASYRPYMNYY